MERAQTCEVGTTPLEIIPDLAAALCAQPDALILDVRSAAEFAAGHVTAAVHLPCSAGTIERDLSDRLSSASVVLVYGDGDADARRVAESLTQQQHFNVRVIAGGYSAWDAAGQACSSGPCELCGEHQP
ncbi:MAG: hypothetical protein A2341_23905 [Deltaproteobacteria bacterium RIFOXYB12_FULL_58_9]|nr:MAG: hypothetical protein A2341_23905 [Deltaproteobacteria bacterium RIFOXYB12_FULL_58_9]